MIDLYREMMKLVRLAPEQDRNEMREWIRSDFKKNKHLTEELDIKMQLSRGRLALREISSAVTMTR